MNVVTRAREKTHLRSYIWHTEKNQNHTAVWKPDQTDKRKGRKTGEKKRMKNRRG
jgi:hypothetical protein